MHDEIGEMLSSGSANTCPSNEGLPEVDRQVDTLALVKPPPKGGRGSYKEGCGEPYKRGGLTSTGEAGPPEIAAT